MVRAGAQEAVCASWGVGERWCGWLRVRAVWGACSADGYLPTYLPTTCYLPSLYHYLPIYLSYFYSNTSLLEGEVFSPTYLHGITMCALFSPYLLSTYVWGC